MICLSHQGTEGKNNGDYSDIELAGATRDIDVIIGGHTHMLYDLKVKNLDGKEIPVVQMAKSGVYLGKIILNF